MKSNHSRADESPSCYSFAIMVDRFQLCSEQYFAILPPQLLVLDFGLFPRIRRSTQGDSLLMPSPIKVGPAFKVQSPHFPGRALIEPPATCTGSDHSFPLWVQSALVVKFQPTWSHQPNQSKKVASLRRHAGGTDWNFACSLKKPPEELTGGNPLAEAARLAQWLCFRSAGMARPQAWPV